MPVSKRKGAIAKADWLFSQIVRHRGACESCGSTQHLQTAHIVRRVFSATRTAEDNAFCLCARCHLRFTHNPLEWVRFVGEARYDALYLRAQAGVPKDFWPGEVARLQVRLQELTASGD